MLYDVRKSFRDVIAADGSSWQGWWNAEFSPTLLSRMTSLVVCNALRLADLRTKDDYSDTHWSMCEAVLEKYSACDKMQASASVPKMQELFNSLFKRSKHLRYDMSKTDFDKMYSRAATNVIKFHDTTHAMNHFLHHVQKDQKLFKKMKKCHEKILNTPSTIAEFHGLFPLACCLNHSCFPNAEIESENVGGRPGIAIKAVQSIKEGEEVTISYVEPHLDREERRRKLWRKYKFVCDCLRCLHEGIGPHICTNCGKNVNKSGARRQKGSISERQEGSKDEAGESIHENTENSLENSILEDAKEPQENSLILDSNSLNTPHKDDLLEDDGSHNDHPSSPSNGLDHSDAAATLTPQPASKFAACGRCKKAWYCCADCQKESWVCGHKKICTPRS